MKRRDNLLRYIWRSGLLCVLLLAPLFVVQMRASAKGLAEGQGLSGGTNLSARQDSGAFDVADSQLFGHPLFSNSYDWSAVAKKSAARQARVNSAVVYVKADASGANNGTSWANAYADLQDALTDATSSEQIWVAAGTYKPTSDTERAVSFQLKSGVAIYGGFNGTESSLFERDWENNVTVLSGDIGAVGDNSDNSYHVVNGSGTASSAILDGVTVTAGYANGSGSDGYGGGMFNESNSSPTVSHVTFTDNSASRGGGVYNHSSSNPTLSDVTFSGNWASSWGGGMFNSKSSPTVSDVTFSSNSAFYGGMSNHFNSDPTVSDVTFSGNSVSGQGGGVYNDYQSSLTVNHVTFRSEG